MNADKTGRVSDAEVRGIVKSPQSVAAGLFLLVLAAFGFLGTLNLDLGAVAAFGPAMVPRTISIMLAGLGGLLIATGMTTRGPQLERWSVRGLCCILGAVVSFAVTIRGFDVGFFRMPALGLAVAGPLCVTLASLADNETRLYEILLFAVGLTLLSVLMFRTALRLPIPIAPWLLGY